MDPYTEKLLERTRARRENLQKKLSERPGVGGRPMAKRLREPLGETNSTMVQPAADTVLAVPQASTKPSPSKRKCSGENLQSAAGEENQEPAPVRPTAPLLSDPPTDKKPPVGPSGSRPPSFSSSSSSTRAAVQPEPERVIPSAPAAPSMEVQQEETAPSAAAMRSRLQRLAEQRRFWDGDAPAEAGEDCPPVSVLRRPAEVPAAVAPAASSEAPVGRRGRLAHLAATIGSWEDDLSHAHIPKESPNVKQQTSGWRVPASPQKTPASSHPPLSSTQSSASSSSPLKTPASSHPPPSSTQSSASSSSPLKTSTSSSSSTTVARSPLKLQTPSTGPNSTCSPHKAEVRSLVAPQEKPPSGAPAVKSFLERFEERCQERSHHPPQTRTPAGGGPQTRTPAGGAPQTRTPAGGASQTRTPAGGAPQTRTPAGGGPQTRTPAGGASQTRTPAGTPNTRLVQDRLRAAQNANTSTADLTQRQKLERESELALIRNRFQKGNNIWKNNEQRLQSKASTDHQPGLSESSRTTEESLTDHQPGLSESSRTTEESLTDHQPGLSESSRTTEESLTDHQPGLSEFSRTTEESLTDHQLTPSESSRTTEPQSDEPAESGGTWCESQDEADTQTPTDTTTGPTLTSPPVSTSSPLRSAGSSQRDGQDQDKEASGDQTINSAVISQLFEGVLDQTEEEEDEEEEDGLNISSMSLLTPLVETVAAVVKSPDRGMMTSTPANSFLVKNNTPDRVSRPSKAQKVHSSSAGSVETCEDELRLPYSVDAYRSTRVKETERPGIRQVIVRKEDVSQKAGEPRGASLFNIKQKMKILTNEMNLQQTVIHQASQALNCCTDEEHGKGSQVEAEAERLLLVATERREALKSELDRLRGNPAAAAPPATSASRGSITLQDLRLPLKADFVCSTASRESTKHSFFIMIRAGAEHTMATPLASTHRGLSGDTLTFNTTFTLSDASSDFEIDVEVYCLVQKRELCTDKKKKTNKSKAITPKRFLAISKAAQTPVVASPGGPHAVRTSNFLLVGSHKLSLSSIGKNKFPLEKIKYEGSERELLSDMFQSKVPFLCPLEGHVFLKLHCEVGSKVEERGFLTMFEDVSGFGAWHRRWCVLSGYYISYWTYPDDERRKNPIGRINLASCTSRAVEPANREFCARPNTMELITARPQRDDDKETLVSQCTNTMCVTKNWLSADTKEERNLWMKKLNQILTDLRMWQPDACYRPQ